MKKIDLMAVLDALESCEAEFEQLMIDEEWYVTDVVDKVSGAKGRVLEELMEEKACG